MANLSELQNVLEINCLPHCVMIILRVGGDSLLLHFLSK